MVSGPSLDGSVYSAATAEDVRGKTHSSAAHFMRIKIGFICSGSYKDRKNEASVGALYRSFRASAIRQRHLLLYPPADRPIVSMTSMRWTTMKARACNESSGVGGGGGISGGR